MVRFAVTIFSLASALAAFAALPTAQTRNAQKSQITVAFWNVENLFDSVASAEQTRPEALTASQLDEKLTKDAAVLKALNADIVGLAEVENRGLVRTLCREYLSDQGYEYFELIEDTDPRGIDVAIISRRPFLAHLFELPGHTRGTLACRFVVDREPFYVFVNHWKSRIGGGEDLRIKSAQEIVRLSQQVIPAYEGKEVPIIIGGDLNDEDTDKSVQLLEQGGLVNTLKKLPPAQRWTLPYDDRTSVLYQGFDHIFMNAAAADHRGVDWVPDSAQVLRPPFMLRKRTIRGKEYEWPIDDYGNTIGYADHFPVKITLQLLAPR